MDHVYGVLEAGAEALMKWETNTNRVRSDRHHARCGHLYVRIEQNEAYKTTDHPDYEPPSCSWFVEPDDEDKSYRRALAHGTTPTLEAAKEAAREACQQIVIAMQTDLRGEP